MSTIKRLLTYLLILLFFLSLIKDITVGTYVNSNNNQNFPMAVTEQLNSELDLQFKITTKQVKNGETILSIIEELNKNYSKSIKIEKFISDFKQLNPNTDPYFLEVGSEYQFPIYIK